MFKKTMFHYLDERDERDFKEFWGTEHQSILVAGSKTSYRLQKYLPENEYYRIRVILTALVRDFELPAVRYTYAIALTIYTISLQEGTTVSEEIKNIADAELALLIEHLLTDEDDDEDDTERNLYDRNIEMVLRRWNEYLSAPSEFVL
jgi:hypothetical protein